MPGCGLAVVVVGQMRWQPWPADSGCARAQVRVLAEEAVVWQGECMVAGRRFAIRWTTQTTNWSPPRRLESVVRLVALVALALGLVLVPAAAWLSWTQSLPRLTVVLLVVLGVVVVAGQAACPLAAHRRVAVKWHVCVVRHGWRVQLRVPLVRLRCRGEAPRWRQLMGR